MTLYQIIDTLKNIALTQPNIRTVMDGDVFDAMNGNPSVRYGVFHVTQTTHTEDDQFDNYGLNLFVMDRLEDDDANRLQIQSTAKQQLSNIINTFCETFDAEHETINYQMFTQRFKDLTAGAWATVTFQVLKDYSCAEGFGDGAWRPEVVIINNQDITISKNGIYEPSEGFTGFGKVDVYVPVPEIKESVSLSLMAGETGVYRPEAPYDGVAEVVYEVEPNQLGKLLEVTDNGSYTVVPDAGYGGMGFVEVNVNVPDLNGSYDEGYDVGFGAGLTEGYDSGYSTGYETGNADGYQRGTDEGVAEYVDGLPTLDITENGVYDQPNKGVNVNVPPAKINPFDYDVHFGFSTFTTLPDVFYFPEHIVHIPKINTDYCMEAFFYSCELLDDISFMEHVTDVTVHTYTSGNDVRGFYQTFDGCVLLKDITPLSNIKLNVVDKRNNKKSPLTVQFDYMLNRTVVEDFTPLNHLLDKLDADGLNYRISVGTSAFASTEIKRFELDWDWSKCTNYSSMLGSPKNLEYVCELDATNVTSGYNPLNIVSVVSGELSNFTYFGGFKNQKLSIDNTYFFTKCPNLTRESCLAIVGNLYDFTGNEETPASGQGKLKVHANFLTALGDDINIAISKGWTITT